MHRIGLVFVVCTACGSAPREPSSGASTATGSSGLVRFDRATTPKRLAGYHRDQPVLAVALAPEARRLATLAHGERAVRIYDVAGGRELCRLVVPPPREDVSVPLLGMAFAPSTDHLAVETEPGTIAIYDATSCALQGRGALHAGRPLTYSDGTHAYPFDSTLRTSGDYLLAASPTGLAVAAWKDLVGGTVRSVVAPGPREVSGGTFDAGTGARLEVDLLAGYVFAVRPDTSSHLAYDAKAFEVRGVVDGPTGNVALLSVRDSGFSAAVFTADGDELATFSLEAHHLSGAALAWKDAHVVLVPSFGDMVEHRLVERPHLLELDVRTRAVVERSLPLTKQRSTARSAPPVMAFDRSRGPAFLAYGNATGGVEVVQLTGPRGAARVVFSADWQGEPKAAPAECDQVVAHLRTLAAEPPHGWDPARSAEVLEPTKQEAFRARCRTHATKPDIACFLAQDSMEKLFPAASPPPCGLGPL